MKDYRCKFCHKVLFKYDGKSEIKLEEDVQIKTGIVRALEIKCPKCKRINAIEVKINSRDWRFAYGSTVGVAE